MPRPPRRHKLQEPLTSLFHLYPKRGEVYRLIGSYDQALKDFVRMHAAAAIQGDEVRQAEAVSYQGLVSLLKGEFEKAEERYNLALEKYLAHRDLPGQVECYNGLGKLMQYLEKNDKAHEYYTSGLDICRKNGDKRNEFKCLGNVAGCCHAINKEEEAIKIAKDLLEYYESVADIKSFGHTHQMMGSIYLDIGDYQTALKYLKTSEDIAIKIGDIATLLNIYTYSGFAYFKTKRYDDAKTLFYNCYELATKQGSKYMQAVSLLNIGDVYNEMGDISQSKCYLDKMRSMNIDIPGLNQEAQRITNELNQKEKEVN